MQYFEQELLSIDNLVLTSVVLSSTKIFKKDITSLQSSQIGC